MIHKKAANESMFKLSEVAQSIIHLLEDEYGEAFSWTNIRPFRAVTRQQF